MQRRPTAQAPFLLLFTLALLELSCARVSNSGTHPPERLYPVALRGKWGYMGSTGTLRIKPAFDEADVFVEERARVSVDKKLGFIDPDGIVVAKPQFEAATSFREGLARVKIGDKWGSSTRLDKSRSSRSSRIAAPVSAPIQDLSMRDSLACRPVRTWGGRNGGS